MDKQDLKQEIKDNKTLAKELEERLKKEFQKVIDDPTEKKIKEYREVEDLILLAWLKNTFFNMTQGINENIANGKSVAVEQLRKKGFKKIEDNAEIYTELANAKKQLIKSELEKIVSNIKANSRKNVVEMRDAFILQKKKLTSSFMVTFRKYGVAYFTDKRGAKWSLERYINMSTTTLMASTNRQSFFAKSLEWGNDLVKVVHLGISPECELCRPFTGKVLSISGRTKGYMTVDEASQSGHLFSYNCDHTVSALELAPAKEKDDNKIHLNEKNIEYLKKRGIKNVKKRAFYSA